MSTKQSIAHSVGAIIAGSLFLATAGQAAPPPHAEGKPPHAKGRILVKPAQGLSEKTFGKILGKAGGRAMGKLKGLGVWNVEVPPQAEAAIAFQLSRKAGIAFAEVDRLVEPVGTANDPYFSKQWHLPKMQAPDAWQYGDGSSVTVAVCDTGVYAGHPDLAGKVLSGWNTVSNSTDSSDIQGHGTMVAGTVAAATNNSLGVAATAPGAQILPVRVSNRTDGYAYYSDIAECIRWAADNGARVANASYMAAGSGTVDNAASYMTSKGGVVTISAGNYNSDPGYRSSPYTFVAAATTSGDNKASYSSYGDYVDITAPGSGIYTTNKGGGYSSVSGTSFSAPNTAAVAALVMTANPSLSPSDVTAVIAQTAQDLGASGWDPYFGHGRVNALAAVQLAANANTSDTTAPGTSIISPTDGADVTGEIAVDIGATDDFGVAYVELLVDGRAVATETQGIRGTYVFGWDSATVDNGLRSLSAVAYDAAGNAGQSETIYVNVSNIQDTTAPETSIVSPGDGAAVSGEIRVDVAASDDTAVTAVELVVDGETAARVTTESTDGSYVFGLDTTAMVNGQHSISAMAFDAAGNVGLSQEIFVEVANASSDAGGLSLSGSGYKRRGDKYVNLAWTGGSAGSVDVYRDGRRVASTANDGAYTYGPFSQGKQVPYKVCEAGTKTCSNEVQVGF